MAHRRIGHLATVLTQQQQQQSRQQKQPAVNMTHGGGHHLAEAPVRCLDYAYSFITGGGPDNAVRFWVESTTTLYDDERGTMQTFFQCASCKSEDTFGRGLERSGRLLFQNPNYDFCPVYSTPPVPITTGSTRAQQLEGGELIIYRRRLADDISGYRSVLPYAKAIDIAFGVPTLRLREAQAVYQLPLDDFDAVAEATRNCVPMVQQTEVRGSDGLRAVIELPVKTMNIAQQTSMPSHHPARTWQTDTGPVAVPDLSRHHARASDALSLVRAVHAYMHVTLACNNAGWAGGARRIRGHD
jgi:hypothetical protein